MPMIADDLAPRLAAAAEGALTAAPVSFRPERHVGVVLASREYPASSPGGAPIAGLPNASRLDDVLVFHAGTARRGDEIVTAGGRVLTVVGRGETYEEAIERAYAGVSKISFDGMHYRRDIGNKALEGTRVATKSARA
jgi:phosphoribosylamine--glycine ligase